MATDDLMKFRTAYLRSIALSWADEDFKRQLVSDSTSAIDVMQRYLGFDWPWPNACTLKFKSVPKFQWICDEWVWPLHLSDHLTLYVPLDPSVYVKGETQDPPTKLPADQRAMALADFYRQRSALFSDGWGEGWGNTGSQLEVSIKGAEGPASPSPAGGFYPDSSEFAAFQVALLAAIAKAWDDQEFRSLLTIDANTALRKVRGYELPWKMTLAIADDADARWHPPLFTGPMTTPLLSHWSFSRPNELTLNLPSKPGELQSEPVALAMYNGTGAAYPFSCTC